MVIPSRSQMKMQPLTSFTLAPWPTGQKPSQWAKAKWNLLKLFSKVKSNSEAVPCSEEVIVQGVGLYHLP